MRKIYAFALSAFMMLPLALNAQTMTNENETLDGMGFRLEKDVNFRDGFVNDKEIVPNNALNFGEEESDVTINGYHPSKLTNEGLEFMSIQLPGNGIDLVNGTGLRSSKNERWIVVNELREGQILAFDISNTDTTSFVVNSYECNSKTGWADNFVDPLIVEPISGEVHAIQELASQEVDTYRYFKVINSGSMYAKFNGKTTNYIYRMQIWTPKGEDEVVTPPTLKLGMVDGTRRGVEFKHGVSTLGSECTTWWGVVEQGEYALYTEDTDEIDHMEYTYQLDEEGNQMLDEEGNPIILEETPVYKQVLVPVEGAYGDRQYVESDGYEIVDDGDDVDGDGYVTIAAASVSANGAFSDIVTLKLAVGEVQLNAPTLSLTALSGNTRTYTLGWSNNTLCGEPYRFIVEVDEENEYEFENEGIGQTFDAKESIKVTVRVDGYTDGINEMDELDLENTDVSKKAVGNNQSEEHNWDFQTLSEEALNKINGKIIDYYILLDDEENEIKRYTVEQYDNGEVPDEEYDKLVSVQKYFGWDGADSRNTARHWRTWIAEYYVTDEGETTDSSISTSYAQDQTRIFDGLVVDNSHPNYSTIAVFNDGNGIYFMSKGTIEIADVKYGEYVGVTINGGTTIYKCENAEGGFTFDVPNGAYLHNIDIYTYNDLPEPDAIKMIETAKTNNGIVYTIDGRIVSRNASLNGLQKGLYIMNGKKYMVK